MNRRSIDNEPCTVRGLRLTDVRRAIPSDADAIVQLVVEVQAFHAAARPDLFKPGGRESVTEIVERIASDDHLYWVATRDDVVIGYAYARLRDEPETRWHLGARVLSLEQMGVARHHRRQGVGACLWGAVRQAAADRGADRVILNVWAFNAPARRFYERLGFAPFRQTMAVELRTAPDADDANAT